MDLSKYKLAEIVTYDLPKLKEVEHDVRRETAMLRMDIYAEKGKNSAAKRSLKKALARVLTVQKEKMKQQSVAAKG